MNRRLVIARWDEDVSWARDYPHVVYDKGGKPLDATGLNVIRLGENPEGHETHTYLWHIIHNYDALDDWTVFVQGHPFDHAREWETQWCAEPASGFAWVGHWLVQDGHYGQPHHHHIIPVGDAYKAIFGKAPPEMFEFIAGAQFVASHERIRSRPLSFWERVQDLGMHDPFEFDWGYTAERLWGYLLND